MKDRRAWLERGKDALILLLTVSAVCLLSMTPLVQDSGLLELLRPQPAAGSANAGAGRTWAVLPAGLAVYRDGERLGLQYDDERMEEQFASLSPLLRDSLEGAGEPRRLTEPEWQGLLRRDSVYFDFAGGIPLAALSGWLGGGGACALGGSARRVALAEGADDRVALCWQDADSGAFFACPTDLSHTLHLDLALSAVEADGAGFAFEDPELERLLGPYTLITEGRPEGAQYAAASPLAGSAGVEALLDALSFNSQNHAPGSGGEVYMDGADRLVVGDGGTVTYRAAQGEKYPVAAAPDGQAAAAAADGARLLAERALTPLCGEARLYLTSVQPHADGWLVRFGYRLDGSAVYLYDGGWAAEFLIQDGFITQFVLHTRSYAANGENALLLPIGRAAVMLPDLSREKQELAVWYRDRGEGVVSPEWVGN